MAATKFNGADLSIYLTKTLFMDVENGPKTKFQLSVFHTVAATEIGKELETAN